MSTRKDENNSYGSSVFDGLGSIYGSAKDTIWGKAVPQMNKGAGGFYDTSFWDNSQWQQFGGKGGIIGDNGQLYNADGTAFDVSSIGGNLKGLGSTTEGGLGSIFGSEGMKTIGGYAQTGQALLGLYSGVDNLFGSGAKDRKDSKNMMKKAFEQNYAMNDLAINKFKEDNTRFKADRERITSSYMS